MEQLNTVIRPSMWGKECELSFYACVWPGQGVYKHTLSCSLLPYLIDLNCICTGYFNNAEVMRNFVYNTANLNFFHQLSNNTMHKKAISRGESQGHGHDNTSCSTNCSTQMFRARYQLSGKALGIH